MNLRIPDNEQIFVPEQAVVYKKFTSNNGWIENYTHIALFI